MPKIQYLKCYNGIQPGTVVNEHRKDVVKRLTAPVLVNAEKKLFEQTARIVPDSTKTTAELEQEALAEVEEAAAAEQKAAEEAQLEAMTAPPPKGTPRNSNKAITRPGDNKELATGATGTGATGATGGD